MKMVKYQSIDQLEKIKFSNEYVAAGINDSSGFAKEKWRLSEIEEFAQRYIQLGIEHAALNLDELSLVRLYELEETMRKNNLDPKYWYFTEEPLKGLWILQNPFIGRSFTVVFHDPRWHSDVENIEVALEDEEHLDKIEEYLFDINQGSIEALNTKNMVEAIILSQPV